jgi:DNA-binding NtrC family response regulator
MAPASGKTVLVVEDEAEIREVIVEYLALHGFAIIEATSGPEALMEIKRARPQVVVLDLNVPRLGGLEALRRIRALDPSITVVLVTDEAEDEVYWRAIECGAHDILPKPVVLDDLRDALEGENPLAAASGEAAARPAPGGAPAVRPGRVLVVERDVGLRAMLERFFAARGHRVTSASDSQSAEHALVQAPPDIVVLDISLEGLQGLQALPTIRALAPHAMVIMMGTIAEQEIARRALARGAFDYVVKPVDLNDLGQSIDMALTMKRLAMEL